MKKIIFILFFVLCVCVNAQPPEKFYRKLGGEGIDIGYAVKQTLGNGFVLSGSSTYYGAGNSDIFLTKLDSMGMGKWTVMLGGFNNDVAKGVIQLADSGFVIVGYTNSFGNGGYDAVLIRTDKNGNQMWLRTMGGNDWDFGYDIIQMADGNIVICGSTTSFGRGKMDGFVAKYDQSGTQLWIKYYGGIEDDDFKGIYTKTGNEIYLAGTTKSFGEINGDMMLYKLNTAGDSLMRVIFGGSLMEVGNDVVLDKNGNIHLAGGTRSFGLGKEDGLILKLSPTGTYLDTFYVGHAPYDEEVNKIVAATSAGPWDIVVNYSEDQQLGTKLDFVNVALTENYVYIPGGNNGSFGFIEGDEEPFDLCNTRDKGFVQVGYTTGINAIDKDILFVKRDSMLIYGTEVVGLSELQKNKERNFTVYPNPVTKNTLLYISLKEPLKEDCKIEISNLAGEILTESKMSIGSEKTAIDLKNQPPGIYFIKISDSQAITFHKVVKF
jgi:hypothetical protein